MSRWRRIGRFRQCSALSIFVLLAATCDSGPTAEQQSLDTLTSLSRNFDSGALTPAQQKLVQKLGAIFEKQLSFDEQAYAVVFFHAKIESQNLTFEQFLNRYIGRDPTRDTSFTSDADLIHIDELGRAGLGISSSSS